MSVFLEWPNSGKSCTTFQPLSDEDATHRRVAEGLVLDPLVVLDFIGLHTNLAREDSIRVDDSNGLDAQLNAVGSLDPDVRVSISNAVEHPFVFDWNAYSSSAAIDGPEELAFAFDQPRLEVQPVWSVQLQLGVQPGVDELAGYRVDGDDGGESRHDERIQSAHILQREAPSMPTTFSSEHFETARVVTERVSVVDPIIDLANAYVQAPLSEGDTLHRLEPPGYREEIPVGTRVFGAYQPYRPTAAFLGVVGLLLALVYALISAIESATTQWARAILRTAWDMIPTLFLGVMGGSVTVVLMVLALAGRAEGMQLASTYRSGASGSLPMMPCCRH